MSSEDAKKSGSPPRSKPTTRSSSLRQSLTSVGSVGRALIAGVRSKESSDDIKTRKAKISTTRQTPVVTSPASRPSPNDTRPTSHTAKPEPKPLARRRTTTILTQARHSIAEEPRAMKEGPILAARRTRPTNAASGIPLRGRPKSFAVESTKPPTPARAGTRRRFSVSSEDGAKEQKPVQPLTPKEKAEKDSRPISPLPHRAALKTSSAVNATPPATPSAASAGLKQGNRSSPTRPPKVLKANPNSSSVSVNRPPSSASSASSTPRTPQTSNLRAALTRSAKDKTINVTTPIKSSPVMTPTRDSPSPTARHSRSRNTSSRQSWSSNSLSSSPNTGNMSHISEGNSEDSQDEEDILEMLGASAPLAAPTPVMPRIGITQNGRRQAVQDTTPSRKNKVTEKDQSRLLPPSLSSNITTRPKLKISRSRGSNTPVAPRQSIISWEEMSNEASRTLGEGEIERMITDIAAPFSGPTSPSLSSIHGLPDIPPSPCLSAIDSPGGFGTSISQVLLPDVTPSPAAFANSSRFNVSPEAASESSATYLRLQLAAAEAMSRDRLMRIQAMEEEIHNLRQAHVQQVEEMRAQVEFIEQQDARARHAAAAAMEEELKQVRMQTAQAVEVAITETETAARTRQANTIKAQRQQFDIACATMVAQTSWSAVLDGCTAELDAIYGEREMLALILADLESIMYSS